MQFEVDNLPENHNWDYCYAPGELDLADERVRIPGPIGFKGRLQKLKEEIQFRGELETVLELCCDRCMEPVELAKQLSLKVDFVPPARVKAAEQRLTEIEFDKYELDGTTIDLNRIVRDEILLAVPDFILCKPDCRGLCQHCGANKNHSPCSCKENLVDPRWQTLQQVKL
jgi:uncharacterized protein